MAAAEAERARLEEASRKAAAEAEVSRAAAEAAKAKGHLSVTVVECTNLKDMDKKSSGTEKGKGWGKENDVYVVVRVSDTVCKRTTVIQEGGANPKFGEDGEGEDLQFDVDAAETAGAVRLVRACWPCTSTAGRIGGSSSGSGAFLWRGTRGRARRRSAGRRARSTMARRAAAGSCTTRTFCS